MSADYEANDEKEAELDNSDYLLSEKCNAEACDDKNAYKKNPRGINPVHKTFPYNCYIGIFLNRQKEGHNPVLNNAKR